jgi:hypothetical protein
MAVIKVQYYFSDLTLDELEVLWDFTLKPEFCN